MSQISIVIVDDEKRIRSFLKNVLKLYYPNATVVAEAENIKKAIEAIKAHCPNVVLLDIKMPDGTGFDLLKQLMPLTFKIIFITAHDQFAIQAIRFSALDYLLKPVIPIELVTALQRAEQQLNSETENSKLNVLLNNMNCLTRETKKIALNSHERIQVVNINDIVRCEADGSYTNFILTNKKTILVSHPIKEYDELLVPYGFFRSHNSHLVNLAFVDRLEKRDGGFLIMKDGSNVLVSYRKYSDLVVVLNNL